MVGFPKELRTKQDYLNAVAYVKSTGAGKTLLLARLESLKANTKIMVLKESSKAKPSEEQTQEDYKAIDDPNCEMIRLGFSETEINKIISEVQNV